MLAVISVYSVADGYDVKGFTLIVRAVCQGVWSAGFNHQIETFFHIFHCLLYASVLLELILGKCSLVFCTMT